mgnify:CR=1 FL=1
MLASLSATSLYFVDKTANLDIGYLFLNEMEPNEYPFLKDGFYKQIQFR